MSATLPFPTILLGPGRQGMRYAQALIMHEAYSLDAVVGRESASCRKASAVLGKPLFYSLEEALQRHPCRFLVIATPDELHFPQVQEALRRGIPTLVEKPLAANISEAGELLALSQGTGVPLLVAHTSLFDPALLKGVMALRSGPFGEVARIYVNHLGGGEGGKGGSHPELQAARQWLIHLCSLTAPFTSEERLPGLTEAKVENAIPGRQQISAVFAGPPSIEILWDAQAQGPERLSAEYETPNATLRWAREQGTSSLWFRKEDQSFVSVPFESQNRYGLLLTHCANVLLGMEKPVCSAWEGYMAMTMAGEIVGVNRVQ